MLTKRSSYREEALLPDQLSLVASAITIFDAVVVPERAIPFVQCINGSNHELDMSSHSPTLTMPEPTYDMRNAGITTMRSAAKHTAEVMPTSKAKRFAGTLVMTVFTR